MHEKFENATILRNNLNYYSPEIYRHHRKKEGVLTAVCEILFDIRTILVRFFLTNWFVFTHMQISTQLLIGAKKKWCLQISGQYT